MIAVSDAVLIVVSAAALSLGLYRWQDNVKQAALGNSGAATTTQVQTQGNNTSATTVQSTTLNGVAAGGNGVAEAGSAADSQLVGSQENPQPQAQPIVVEGQTPTTTINVANDTETSASNEAVVDVPPYGSYIVQPGDSLSQIARQYGTTVSTLQEINDIEGSLITIGQELRYPQPAN